jgi:hypothetical protein
MSFQGRDASESNGVENELLSRAIESLKKAKAHSERQQELQQQILALEGEMKTNGGTAVPHPVPCVGAPY